MPATPGTRASSPSSPPRVRSPCRRDAGPRDLDRACDQLRAGRLIARVQDDRGGLEAGEVLRRPEPDDVGATVSGRQGPVPEPAGREDQVREVVGQAGVAGQRDCVRPDVRDREAARLEGLSCGSDVIISRSVFEDSKVQELIESENISAEPFYMSLKGFEDERFELWRVSRR